MFNMEVQTVSPTKISEASSPRLLVSAQLNMLAYAYLLQIPVGPALCPSYYYCISITTETRLTLKVCSKFGVFLLGFGGFFVGFGFFFFYS